MIDAARQRAKNLRLWLTKELEALSSALRYGRHERGCEPHLIAELPRLGCRAEASLNHLPTRRDGLIDKQPGQSSLHDRMSHSGQSSVRSASGLGPERGFPARAKRLRRGAVDQLRFLKNWAGNPLKTGAVAPSGRELSRIMAAYVEDERPGVIVELGPGTGSVTKALLARGLPAERLVLIEYSSDFCKLLRKRFPGVKVVNGNAYALGEVMESLGNPPVASVISGLPLFTRPLEERQNLLSDAMRLMWPGAPFIQFSYAPVPPVTRVAGTKFSTTRWVLANLPPARVWLYRATDKAGYRPR